MSLSGDVNSISSNQSYVSLAYSAGFYPMVGEGLSIEPEIFYGRTNGTNSVNVGGNLSYGYEMGYWPVVPFALVGYGVGDGIPFYQPMGRVTNGSTDISYLNAGVGAKVMTLGGRALLRVEYRYQDYSEKLSSLTKHVFGRRLLLGFSVLL